jgi:O-antigen ligase
MTDRLPKLALFAGLILSVPLLVYMALTRPFYFTNQTLLGGVVALELLLVALWFYRRVFFALIVAVFLFAGTGLPGGGLWTSGRWAVLGMGAFAGGFIMLKERSGRFVLFHALAVFAVLSALVAAAVSRYPGFALMKAVSLLLLFLYASTGARLAALDRENRFLTGLLMGSEIAAGVLAVLYLIGNELLGNPNSLGAVMAVLAPVLLWGILLNPEPLVYHRRLVLFFACMYLLFHSQSRAGLVAGFISCGLMCLALRRYKVFVQGVVMLLIVITSAAIVSPEKFAGTVSSLTSSVVYKDKDPGQGVFASRRAPWQAATDSIKKHLWFGSGFGTTDTGQDASQHLGVYSTTAAATSENGSSYLTIVSWVGLVGVVPFFLLLLSLVNKIARTVLWMMHTGNPFHPAVPIAMVVLTGLIHAMFEDWLFAPGYYMCVYFWSLAFVFVDLAPWAPLPSFSVPWSPLATQPGMSGATLSR